VLGYYANWQILSGGEHNLMFRHTWSLALEEQFYLVWPWLFALLLALRARRGWVVGLVLLGIVLPVGLRNLRWAGPESWVPLYHGTETRTDGLFTGCLLALVLYWEPALPRPGWRLLLCLAVLPALAVLAWHALTDFRFLQGHLCRAGFTFLSLSSAVLIAVAVCCPPATLRWALELRPLCWLGRISYGLYLWHMPVYQAIAEANITDNFRLEAWRKVAASLVVATVSYYALEQPFLRWKERLRRSRTGAAEVPAPIPSRRAA
jgi:peptidoglycan/LPS O-acetylase OafA/YrhL